MIATMRPFSQLTLVSALLILHGSGLGATQAKDDPAADFEKRIRPLLTRHCLGCHSTQKKKGGLNLERFAALKQVRADIELVYWSREDPS